MSHKQIQLEIFERGSKTKKGLKVHRETSDNFPVHRFPTQLCVKVACSIILLIMSFALGVERGKVISKRQISSRFLADGKTQEITKEFNVKNNKLKRPPVAIKELENKEKSDKIIASEYIVQVATYKKNSSYVKRETAKLQKSGYKTLTITSGKYMQVCAGKFANKKIANKHLNKLKQIYKDCFIRKI